MQGQLQDEFDKAKNILNTKINGMEKIEEILKKAKDLKTKAQSTLKEYKSALKVTNANEIIMNNLEIKLDELLDSMHNYTQIIDEKHNYYENCDPKTDPNQKIYDGLIFK